VFFLFYFSLAGCVLRKLIKIYFQLTAAHMNLPAEHSAHQIAQFASAGLKDKGLTINL